MVTCLYILTGNPLKCNCSLLNFVHRQKEKRINEDVDLALQCNSNSSTLKLPNCPDSCSCKCTDYEDDSFILVDCSSKNLTAFPQFWRSNLPHMKVSNETFS